LLGLYAAEGSNTNGNCLEFSFHEDEVQLFKKYFDNLQITFNTYARDNSKGVSCRFSDLAWKELCNSLIGNGAKTKRLSKHVVFASDESIKSFLGAFIDGDGCLKSDSQKVGMFTASSDLAHQLVTMCRNVGLSPNIYKRDNNGGPTNRDKECIIYEVLLSKSDAFQLKDYSIKLQNLLSSQFISRQKPIIDNKIFSKYEAVLSNYHGDVFNLEIESPNNEHSYVANDIAVHNCDHKPGAIYDGAKCFIIAGELVYDEYSFVNVPADRHSKVLELHYNGIRDSVNIAEDYTGKIYEVNLEFPQYDSATKEEGEMTLKVDGIKDSVTADPTPESKTEETKVEDKKPAFLEGKEKEEDKDGDKDKKKSKKSPKKKKDSEEHEDDCECDECEAKKATLAPKKDEVTPEVKNAATEEDFDTFITRVLSDAKLSEKDQDRMYALMWEEIENAKKDGELTTEIKDAKLSGAKRKGLAKSTFCGPNRSFPVPDCAHVTAARRLVARYKGPGDKSSILSCVARKAKALGCGSEKKKDEVVKDAVTPPVEQQVIPTVAEAAPVVEVTPVTDESHEVALMKMYASEMEKLTGKSYETKAKKPDQGPENAITKEEVEALRSILRRLGGLLGRDAMVQALVEEELALAPDCERALVDEVVKTEDIICQLRDELDALKKEYATLFKDMETLQDAVTNSNVASRKTREAHLKTLVTLRDKKLADATAFTTLSDEAVNQELEKLTSEVDMVKITDKLGDGMSKVPAGEVDLAKVIQDKEKKKAEPQKREYPIADLLKIQEQFYTLLIGRGAEAAEAFMTRMKAEGKVPSDTEIK